jgi:RNase P subunit RPR2
MQVPNSYAKGQQLEREYVEKVKAANMNYKINLKSKLYKN